MRGLSRDFAAHPRGFLGILSTSSTVLESVFSKCARTTGNALGFTARKTQNRVLFHSFCVLFSRFLPPFRRSVPNKIYWTVVKITSSCWRHKSIKVDLQCGLFVFILLDWKDEKASKKAENEFLITVSPVLTWKSIFLSKSCVSPHFLTPRAHSLYTVNLTCLHQFPSHRNFLHHGRTLNLNPSGSFLLCRRQKEHPIKSPDIKSAPP